MRKEHFVECKSGNMACGIDAESVDTHLDESRIAVYKIVCDCRMLSVEVNAVSGDLSPPARRIVPVEPCFVMPEIVGVAVGEV